MLVCEACDKGYHTFCLEPAGQGLPASSWKCKVRPALPQGLPSAPRPPANVPLPPFPQDCRLCSDCGRCPAGLAWSSSVCEGCQQCRVTEAAHAAPAPAPQPDPPTQP